MKIGLFTSRLKRVVTAVLISFVFLLILEGLVAFIDQRSSENLRVSVEAIFRNDQTVGNTAFLDRRMADLETLGLLSCVKVHSSSAGDIYDTTFKNGCEHFWWNQNLWSDGPIKALSGEIYQLQFKMARSVSDSYQIILFLFLGLLLTQVTLFWHWSRVDAQNRELALSQSLADLAVQVSHDIRSPLSALNMAVAKMDGVSDDNRALIQKVSQRISQIADDLLKRHQPKVTTATSRPQSSLKELLEQIYTEKKLALGAESGVVLKLDLCEAEAFCDVDRSALARVLSNLLNNSIESLAEDGQVTLALRSHGESRVQILVSDNGKGIPSEVLQKLGKEKISFGKEGRGSGVGLLYAHRVIAKMGGQMTIQSQVGVGTLVTILLPTSRNS